MVTKLALLDENRRKNYAPTFLGLEEPYTKFENAEICILPVPYDKTSSYHKGADRGPKAILEASTQVELYDIETASEVFRHGIITLAPIEFSGPPDEHHQILKEAVELILSWGKFPLVLGGEHSISSGIVAGMAKKYQNLSVLQLDAHGDTRASYLGSPYNHACVMARVKELCPVVQVGIRAIDQEEAPGFDPERTFFAYQIHAHGTDTSWQDQVIETLSANVYVTIDLDCFDSSLMPSTGTPEPGGLFWHQVMPLLYKLSRRRKICGFDVVELLPRPENPAPDFLAAKLSSQFLSYIFSSKNIVSA